MSLKSPPKSKSAQSYPSEFREKAVKPKLDPETALRMELGENENVRLRKEVARLKMENAILKKATAYFARETL